MIFSGVNDLIYVKRYPLLARAKSSGLVKFGPLMATSNDYSIHLYSVEGKLTQYYSVLTGASISVSVFLEVAFPQD